ncbi:MAG: biopolymer transporter ExbD [Gemmatimonadetes bacterium]|nr:MAG: biopolymer transporter ExbD [Gemmatimonadota bacterium]
MAFGRRAKVDSSIPSSAMGDIAFLLLIFFMVSTVFDTEKGLPIQEPRAEEAKKVPKSGVMHIWMDARGTVVIDDMRYNMDVVHQAMQLKMAADPSLIASLKVDKDAPYRNVSDLMIELRKARALRVNFSTRPDKR